MKTSRPRSEEESPGLIYASHTTDTDEEVRRGYAGILKMGLIPFISQTPIRDLQSIEYREEIKPTDVVDLWNFWVFSLSIGAELNSETQQKRQDRITPSAPVEAGLGQFIVEGYPGDTRDFRRTPAPGK